MKSSTILSLQVDQRQIAVSGRFVRVATVFDENWLGEAGVTRPEVIAADLRRDRRADVFAFSQPLNQTWKDYQYPFLIEDAAIARCLPYQRWWEGLPQEARKNVRRSARRGVTTKVAAYDDTFVEGIRAIYNETPTRQGRRFLHFGKSFDVVKRENSSYLDRSFFVGAYHEAQLIGFIKVVVVDDFARIMQILSMEEHVDKRPTNALIAKAMELCGERKLQFLVYGQYVYGNKKSSPMVEFKRRNGFERLEYKRYHVPLTRRGKLFIRFGCHRGVARLIPEPITNVLLDARAAFYARALK